MAVIYESDRLRQRVQLLEFALTQALDYLNAEGEVTPEMLASPSARRDLARRRHEVKRAIKGVLSKGVTV